MADGYALALQKGLVAALKGSSGLAALVGTRIYDEPPDAATRPFVRIGNIEPAPLRTQCGAAARVPFSIQVHSRPVTSGRVEATRIAEAVVGILDEAEATVVVENYALVKLHWITQTVGRDDDGESYLAIIGFDTLIDG